MYFYLIRIAHIKKFLKELMPDCYTKVLLCHICIRWVDCRHCHFDLDKPNMECICYNSILSILDPAPHSHSLDQPKELLTALHGR